RACDDNLFCSTPRPAPPVGRRAPGGRAWGGRSAENTGSPLDKRNAGTTIRGRRNSRLDQGSEGSLSTAPGRRWDPLGLGISPSFPGGAPSGVLGLPPSTERLPPLSSRETVAAFPAAQAGSDQNGGTGP